MLQKHGDLTFDRTDSSVVVGSFGCILAGVIDPVLGVVNDAVVAVADGDRNHSIHEAAHTYGAQDMEHIHDDEGRAEEVGAHAWGVGRTAYRGAYEHMDPLHGDVSCRHHRRRRPRHP